MTEVNTGVLKITAIGSGETVTRNYEVSTDFNADALGEHITEVMQHMLKVGEDVTDVTVVISFK